MERADHRYVRRVHARIARPSSGYAYTYGKTLRLTPGKPELVIEHSLRNTGTKTHPDQRLRSQLLRAGSQPPGPGTVITLPFKIQTAQPPENGLAEIRGNQFIYLKQSARKKQDA